MSEWVFLNPVEVSVILVHSCPVYWRVYIPRFRNVIRLLDQLPFIEVGSLVNTWFPYCQSHLCFLVEKCRKYVWVEEGKNCIQWDFVFHDAKAGILAEVCCSDLLVSTRPSLDKHPWSTNRASPTRSREQCFFTLVAAGNYLPWLVNTRGPCLPRPPGALAGPVNRWGGMNRMLRAEAQGRGTACVSRCWNVPEKCSDKMQGCRQRPGL